jgi:hypothetical protein
MTTRVEEKGTPWEIDDAEMVQSKLKLTTIYTLTLTYLKTLY